MNFKIRTYKKAGIEKGNLESELFYDTAEETLTKYKELFRREYLALNPTLWARSGNDKEWYRYSEPDFRKFFTGGRRKIDITECSSSVNCCNELVMNFEEGYVEALFELWIDVDKYFGTNTAKDDSTWINFYTYWHPDGTITAVYFINSDEGDEEHEWKLTEQEEYFFLEKMNSYSMNLFHVSIQQLWNTSLEQERLIDEISQKDISVNWIRRVAENYVATANPENWKGNGEKPKGFGICSNVSYNETGKYPFIKLGLSENSNYDSGYAYKIEISLDGSVTYFANCGIEYGAEGLFVEIRDYFLDQRLLPEAPLSIEDIRNSVDENGRIEGIIKVHISDIIDRNLDEFLDFISVALTGSDLLMNIYYETVALSNTEKDTLYVRVSGDASSILEMAGDE